MKAKGIVAIVVSAFGFALMAALVRLADDYGQPLSSFQKSFFRNVVAFVVAAAVFLRGRRATGFRSAALGSRLLLLARATLGTVGIFANFYALSHIPIATGQMLNKTAPFFTVVFAWAFLGERAFPRQVAAIIVAFAGAMLVVKPGFAGADAFPLAIGLIGGAAAGGAYVCVRALRRREVDPAFIILFFSAFSCVASVPFMVPGFQPMTLAQVAILLGAGAAAALGQFGVTLAYGYAAPRDLAVYDYSSVLFAAAFGYILFAQVPDVFSVLGFAVIVAGVAILHSRHQRT